MKDLIVDELRREYRLKFKDDKSNPKDQVIIFTKDYGKWIWKCNSLYSVDLELVEEVIKILKELNKKVK